MKNSILWGTLFAMASTAVSADQTPQIPPQQTLSTPMSSPAPTPAGMQPAAGQVQTTTPTQAAPAAPVINCDYKIPAQTKKIDPNLVLQWSSKAVVQAFNFDPIGLDSQMQQLQNCFTEQGWTGFNAALQKSGNIEAIKSQKLTVTSQIQGQVLVNETKDNQWKFTVPLAVTYQNDKEKVSQLLSVDLTVGRKVTGDLGITQMIAAPRGTVTIKKQAPVVVNPENTSLDTRPTDDN